MVRVCVIAGGIFGAVGLVAAAAGAHVFAGLEAGLQRTYQTAEHIAVLHAAALLALAALQQLNQSNRGLRFAAVLFICGVVLFSFGLLLKVTTGIHAFGHLAPFGGGALIGGWVMVTAAGLSLQRQ